jgi:molybdopterin-containing oxidoreductase family iron-sulfur binding subunit
LALMPYRPSTYAAGSGANLPWLREMRPHAGRKSWATEAELHPATAAKLGIAAGDRVLVESPSGAIECSAWLTRGVHEDALRIAQGGGHTAFGRYARGVGANVMTLVSTERQHPFASFDSLYDTRVRVRKLA